MCWRTRRWQEVDCCFLCVRSNAWIWGSGCWGSRGIRRRHSSASKHSSGWFNATSSSRSPWPPPCWPSPGSNPPAPPPRAPRPRPCRRATPTARMTPTTSPPPPVLEGSDVFFCERRASTRVFFKPNTFSAYEIRLFILYLFMFLALMYLRHKVRRQCRRPKDISLF